MKRRMMITVTLLGSNMLRSFSLEVNPTQHNTHNLYVFIFIVPDSSVDKTLDAMADALNLDIDYTVYNKTVDNVTGAITAILEFKDEETAAKFSETVNNNMEAL